MKQIPSFFSSIRLEHKLTQSIIKQYNIDLIISDNRYGLWSNEVHSVIITHQTTPSTGKHFSFFKPLSNALSRYWLRKFNECWVPDIESPTKLSGTLSGTITQLNTHHIGLPSRLSLVDCTTDDTCEVLIILSGPEPQRSILERTLIRRFKNSHFQTILLSGTPGGVIRKEGSVQILPHCHARQLKSLIINSRYIICRSGYSTLIDLIHCHRTALLIPTPGQYEQEYLAVRASDLWGFSYINQQQLEEVALERLLHEQITLLPFNGSTDMKLPMWL
nr:glycosyltransferase [Carboxylicivirga mesophila]